MLSGRKMRESDNRINLMGMRKFPLILMLLFFDQGFAQQNFKNDSIVVNRGFNRRFEIGAEYLVPTKFSNKIKTISLSAFFWKKHFKKISVLFNVGVTTTYGWGNIVRRDKISDTVIKIDSYKSSAFGIGPVLQTQFSPIIIKRFSVMLEISGGFILYDHHFPYGGDIYNFMLRTGPSLAYRFSDNSSFKIGYRWMHVSNGQGNGIQNPFYEAWGINASLIFER